MFAFLTKFRHSPETRQQTAKRRCMANHEALRRDKEFYRRWVNPPDTRW